MRKMNIQKGKGNPKKEFTIFLVGKTGNGKSSTANSIIGRNEFEAKMSLSGVTSKCRMATFTDDPNYRLTVFDTPGN